MVVARPDVGVLATGHAEHLGEAVLCQCHIAQQEGDGERCEREAGDVRDEVHFEWESGRWAGFFGGLEKVRMIIFCRSVLSPRKGMRTIRQGWRNLNLEVGNYNIIFCGRRRVMGGRCSGRWQRAVKEVKMGTNRYRGLQRGRRWRKAASMTRRPLRQCISVICVTARPFISIFISDAGRIARR